MLMHKMKAFLVHNIEPHRDPSFAFVVFRRLPKRGGTTMGVTVCVIDDPSFFPSFFRHRPTQYS